MRAPRPRFTVRGLMVAVAVAGLNLHALAWLARNRPTRTGSVEMGYWHISAYSDGRHWVTTLDGSTSMTRGPSRSWVAGALAALAPAAVADAGAIAILCRARRARARLSGGRQT